MLVTCTHIALIQEQRIRKLGSPAGNKFMSLRTENKSQDTSRSTVKSQITVLDLGGREEYAKNLSVLAIKRV